MCEKGKALVVFKKKNRNQNKVDDGNIGNINDVTISMFFKWLQILVHVIRSLYIYIYIYINLPFVSNLSEDTYQSH